MSDATTETVAVPSHEPTLAARARAMDPAAWAEIYATHHAVIYRYVRARVFEEAAAEDITSATFVAALQGIRSYRERGRPLLAWLYTIARNKVADHQRHASSERRLTDRLLPWRSRDAGGAVAGAPSEQASSDADPADGVERLAVNRAIAALPGAQRDVILLRHFAGLSTTEICQVMGKKAPAVYSLEARALASLREKLADFAIPAQRPTKNARPER